MDREKMRELVESVEGGIDEAYGGMEEISDVLDDEDPDDETGVREMVDDFFSDLSGLWERLSGMRVALLGEEDDDDG